MLSDRRLFLAQSAALTVGIAAYGQEPKAKDPPTNAFVESFVDLKTDRVSSVLMWEDDQITTIGFGGALVQWQLSNRMGKVLELSDKFGGDRILVGSTHLLAVRYHGDLQLWQRAPWKLARTYSDVRSTVCAIAPSGAFGVVQRKGGKAFVFATTDNTEQTLPESERVLRFCVSADETCIIGSGYYPRRTIRKWKWPECVVEDVWQSPGPDEEEGGIPCDKPVRELPKLLEGILGVRAVPKASLFALNCRNGEHDCYVGLVPLDSRKDPDVLAICSQGSIEDIAFSPSGNLFAVYGDFAGLKSADEQTQMSPGERYAIRIYDRRTREKVCELTGHRAYLGHVSFDPAGRRLASRDTDGVLRVWKLKGKLLELAQLN